MKNSAVHRQERRFCFLLKYCGFSANVPLWVSSLFPVWVFFFVVKSHKDGYLVFVSIRCSWPACCCEVGTTWPRASLSLEYVSLNQSNCFAPLFSDSLFVDSFEFSWLCQGPLWDGHNLTPTEGHWRWTWGRWVIVNNHWYTKPFHCFCVRKTVQIVWGKIALHPRPWTQAKRSTTSNDASQLGQCNTCWRSKFKNFFRKSVEGQLKQWGFDEDRGRWRRKISPHNIQNKKSLLFPPQKKSTPEKSFFFFSHKRNWRWITSTSVTRRLVGSAKSK